MYFIHILLSWYKNHKRALPWRENTEVYSVWVSEIILQQTRVNQGMGYYQRFISAFPTLDALANATEQEVLNQWQGLGYYSRARNMLRAAKMITEEYNGVFPSTFLTLKKLPGIGPYTAAAIASISFGEAVPAIDGNAYRVYARYLGIKLDIAGGKAFSSFFEAGKTLISEESPGDFNQAIMELGARICLPQNPLCNKCPVKDSCYALVQKEVAQLPIKTKKIRIKKMRINYYFIQYKKTFLLRYRGEKDIWQGLYDFPTDKEVEKEGLCLKGLSPAYSVKHTLSHRQLEIHFYCLNLEKENFVKFTKQKNIKKVSFLQTKSYPMPKPIVDFLKKKQEKKTK